MPLYEFRCEPCGVFEQWRVMAEASNPAFCPTCQSTAKRIFSAPAVMLSSSLRLRQENSEPQLIKRPIDTKPKRLHNHAGGRPWMISH